MGDRVLARQYLHWHGTAVGTFSVLTVADSEMVYFVFLFRMFGLLLLVSYSTACLNRLDKTTATQFLTLNVSEGPMPAYSFFFSSMV
jgi:hypothetical protein